MNLQAKAITIEEAKRLGAVPFSHPCRIGTDRVTDEQWIIRNMIADLDRGNIEWLVVKVKHRNSTSIADALELWKLH
tara:strand:+ start:912 stop:1142 length:231 start_codon:yes stop_codon:yes gene_type:complete